MTNEKYEEALVMLDKFTSFLEQLDPLAPNVAAAMDDARVQAACLAERLEELRDTQVE